LTYGLADKDRLTYYLIGPKKGQRQFQPISRSHDMSKDNSFSKKFNRVAKGAAAGAGIAVVGAALLPVITVSVPVIAVGAAVGAIIAHKNNGPQ
jgi:hypothetical protein